MIYCLILILIILIFVSLLINNCDIIAPWVLSSMMFLISVLVATANANKWEMKIHAETLFLISVGLIMFGIGNLVAISIMKKGVEKPSIAINNYYIKKEELKISRKLVFLSSVISIMGSYLIYIKTMAIIKSLGGLEKGQYALAYYRRAQMTGEASLGIILTLINFLIFGLAFVFLYVLIYNKIINKKSIFKNWYLLIPSVAYWFLSALSTSRSGFIQYVAYLIFIIVILSNYKNSWKTLSLGKTFKLIMLGMGMLFIFFVVFIQLGTYTGKSSFEDATEVLSVYIGSSIPALDNYLIEDGSGFSNVFGEETIIGIRDLLNKFGVETEKSVKFLEFTYLGKSISTNVYTSLRRYHHDYGFLGMMLMQSILGFLYTYFYLWIKKYNKVGFSLILYSYMGLPLVYQGIEEQFFVTLFSITQIMTLLFSFVLYWLIKKNKASKLF
ncbi:MAG: O-antigen polymerase [Eubacteriaceae bacterium]